MRPISFKRHRFPADVIRHAVWLYYRFTMSSRDVEDLLAERGMDVPHETIRCWANKLGPAIASNIRMTRQCADCVWHLDELVVKIGGQRMYMWRAADKDSEALDILVRKRRNKYAGLKLLRKLLKSQGFVLTRLHYANWAHWLGISQAVCRKTIAPKIHICPFEDGSEKCSASSPKARPSDSFQPTRRSTTPSISSVTSSLERQCEP